MFKRFDAEQSSAFAYDALGRLIRETGPQGTACSEWDDAGRRTKLVYPTSNCASSSAFFVTYDWYITGEPRYIFERGITTGPEHLATIALDPLGNRERLVRGNGTRTLYEYDPVSRLAELTLDFPLAADDQITTFTHNPASQITSLTRTNDAWAFTGLTDETTNYTANGLNQYATVDGTAPTYDARGNMTFDPVSGKTYGYWPSNNQLRTVSSPFTSLSYDALDRLSIIDSGTDTRFAYDGLDVIAEYDGAGALRNRYVFVPGIDEPLVSYTAAGTRTWLTADERGSIVAHSNDAGTVTQINRYDEFGIPASTNAGRFQYTGQMWLPEAGVYHYKFRAYDPKLGRFLQPDPIGYASGMNLYAYVGNDPVNFIDPLGLKWVRPRVCIGNWCSEGKWRWIGEPNDPRGQGAGLPGGGVWIPLPPRDVTSGDVPADDEETQIERRERLIAEERERVERNAFCASLRVDAFKSAIGLSAGASFVTNLIDKGEIGASLKGLLSRGSIIVTSVIGLAAGYTATEGYEQCE